MRLRALLAATAGLALAATMTAVIAPEAGAADRASTSARHARAATPVSKVTDIPVSFTVQNVNRSAVACAADGQNYTIRGQLIGPAADLAKKRVDLSTLYLHGLSFGEFFYDFRANRNHNYALDMARRGQVSVVVDRLGYGSSDKPDGNQVCVGSRADMAHQMVQALRSGSYQTDRGRSPKFRKVVLAGHSFGGQIAQVEAYSFGDIAGLVVLAYADRVQSDLLRQNAAYTTGVCANGGLKVSAGGPGGYAPFGDPSGAAAALFNSAPSAVERAALQQLTIDPCGDVASFNAATAVDLQRVGGIQVPVLVVGGGADKLFPAPAANDQASLFTASRSVTARTLAATAHALTFEKGENDLVRIVSRFVDRKVS